MSDISERALERGSRNDEGRCVQAGASGVLMSGLCLPASAPPASLLPPVLLTDLPLSGIPAASGRALLLPRLTVRLSLPRSREPVLQALARSGLLSPQQPQQQALTALGRLYVSTPPWKGS